MKRLLALSLGTLMLLALGGCGKASAPSSNEAPSISVTPPPAPSSSSAAPDVVSPAGPQKPPIPADAALYRGTVTQLSQAQSPAGGSFTQVTLEQAEGTNYGAPSLKFIFTDHTRADFTPEAGQYLEVYYGTAPGAPLDKELSHEIIVAIKHHSAEMVNYNGFIKAIVPHPEKADQGRLVMVPTLEDTKGDSMPAPGEIHFNYGKQDTQFYLNFDELKVGDHLNIFQSGAMAMSMPPQSFAIEVRKYAEPAAK